MGEVSDSKPEDPDTAGTTASAGSRRIGLPQYQKIARLLLREIASGHLPDGARLLPERELARRYDTAVGTLRKALHLLEAEGRLERIQGSGNYVRAAGVRDSVYSLFRLEALDQRGAPNASLISIGLVEKPGDVPQFGLAATATRIRRIRRLGKTPVALEEIWLDASVGVLQRDQISDALYLDYADHLQLLIHDVEDRVSIGVIPRWRPPAFPLANGSNCGFVERFARTDNRVAIEFSRTWFDPATCFYVQRMQ